jgi:hypothetical protein
MSAGQLLLEAALWTCEELASSTLTGVLAALQRGRARVEVILCSGLQMVILFRNPMLAGTVYQKGRTSLAVYTSTESSQECIAHIRYT